MENAAEILISENAVRRIAHLLSDEPQGSYFRLGVSGGGCSGFQYLFDLDRKPLEPTDKLIERNGAKIVVDDVSLGIIGGSELDYVETLGEAGFAVKNPHATAKCGCGNSFSV